MSKIGPVPGNENAADVLTRDYLSENRAAWLLMTTNKICLKSVWRVKKGNDEQFVQGTRCFVNIWPCNVWIPTSNNEWTAKHEFILSKVTRILDGQKIDSLSVKYLVFVDLFARAIFWKLSPIVLCSNILFSILMYSFVTCQSKPSFSFLYHVAENICEVKMKSSILKTCYHNYRRSLLIAHPTKRWHITNNINALSSLGSAWARTLNDCEVECYTVSAVDRMRALYSTHNW